MSGCGWAEPGETEYSQYRKLAAPAGSDWEVGCPIAAWGLPLIINQQLGVILLQAVKTIGGGGIRWCQL